MPTKKAEEPIHGNWEHTECFSTLKKKREKKSWINANRIETKFNSLRPVGDFVFSGCL